MSVLGTLQQAQTGSEQVWVQPLWVSRLLGSMRNSMLPLSSMRVPGGQGVHL
jgi:hypothetical protein